MKIIDTFMFSEEYEKEVLLLKFHLEDDGVYEWVIVENTHTFQGEYKGLHLERILSTDSRFNDFRNKIKIISGQIAFPAVSKNSNNDKITFLAEYTQRDLAKSYILEKYADDDYVFLSDADEAIDFSDVKRKNLVWEKIKGAKGDDIICIPRVRFAYDFDNLWLAKRSTPLVKVKLLKTNKPICDLRFENIVSYKRWPQEVLFEYSTCFSIAHIKRKCDSFSHTGTTLAEIERAMICNHMPIAANRGLQLTLDARNWYKRIILTKDNSPKYVRDNFEMLRTNNIALDYVENRRKNYPDLFSIKGACNHSWLKLKKKFSNLIIKIKARV